MQSAQYCKCHDDKQFIVRWLFRFSFAIIMYVLVEREKALLFHKDLTAEN